MSRLLEAAFLCLIPLSAAGAGEGVKVILDDFGNVGSGTK